jgi:hypothetical protein
MRITCAYMRDLLSLLSPASTQAHYSRIFRSEKTSPVISSGKFAPGPDPRIRHRIQIGMFRPIRVDHTNCLQVAIKTHSFIGNKIPTFALCLSQQRQLFTSSPLALALSAIINNKKAVIWHRNTQTYLPSLAISNPPQFPTPLPFPRRDAVQACAFFTKGQERR